MTVLVPLGGHIVIFGNKAFDIGNVCIDVAMGDFSHDEKEFWIRIAAVTNPPVTTATHKSLMKEEREVEMWVRPWMVEDSKNSLNPSN